MTGIFFYSILIFILLSVFVPSIYKYAYSCFIGRIVLVLLIIYFSKHNIILGLVFVTIIIIASMSLYEGFSPKNILAKNMLVTSNTSIKDKTNSQEVFDYFTKYYCAKDSTSPNQDKLKRWNNILKSGDSDSDSKDIALSNIMLQTAICPTDTSKYYQNYNNNWRLAYPSGFNPLYSNVNPRSISGCSYKNTNHVLNTPGCLLENIKSRVCNDESIRSMIPAAQNVSNNPKLDPYFQQDGQWMLNMYSQLCPETSPVI